MREGVKMRRCEDEKMFYRPPLLEEPCAQTLSGKNMVLHPNKLGYNPYDYLKSIHLIPLMTGTGLSSSFSVLSLLFVWLWLKKVYLKLHSSDLKTTLP